MNMLNTTCQASVTASINNILNQQGILNQCFVLIVTGTDLFFLNRTRQLQANITNYPQITASYDTSGKCSSLNFVQDEVFFLGKRFIEFTTCFASFSSVLSAEFNSIQGLLNSTASCNASATGQAQGGQGQSQAQGGQGQSQAQGGQGQNQTQGGQGQNQTQGGQGQNQTQGGQRPNQTQGSK
jgi:hypothetical protein